MSDEAFLAAFERLAIAGPAFGHRQHLRAAWLCLRRDGFAAGAARFVTDLRRFVDHLGATAKYHETITWFFLVTLQQRIERDPACATWDAFLEANGDLADSRALLRRHYSEAALQSPLARAVLVWPDRLAGIVPVAEPVPVADEGQPASR